MMIEPPSLGAGSAAPLGCNSISASANTPALRPTSSRMRRITNSLFFDRHTDDKPTAVLAAGKAQLLLEGSLATLFVFALYPKGGLILWSSHTCSDRLTRSLVLAHRDSGTHD